MDFRSRIRVYVSFVNTMDLLWPGWTASTGGFDMLGAGRHKIESEEQFQEWDVHDLFKGAYTGKPLRYAVWALAGS